MNFFFKSLRDDDPSSPVAYHLEGLLEAIDRIRWHMAAIEAAVGLDPEELAGRMVDLQVEIFDHMGYHMKQLRRPFERHITRAYQDLERASSGAKQSTSRGNKKGAAKTSTRQSRSKKVPET